MAGIDSTLISLLQLPPTLVLIVGVFLLTDIELSDVVPGANDNASGVATVLSLAEELGANPPAHLDVWVLLTGAEECLQEGMRSFVRAHRRDLDRETTYFVNSTRSVAATSASRRAPDGSSPISSIDAWWSSATRSRPPIVRNSDRYQARAADPRPRR